MSCRKGSSACTGRARAASGSSHRAPTCRRWSRGSRSTTSARRGYGARPTWASGCRSRSWRAPTTIPPARPRWRTRCRSPSSSCSRACRPSSAPRDELATRFSAAAEQGDLEALEELLAHDVVLHGDGGGKAPAVKRAIHGRAKVARALTAGLRATTRFGGFTTRREELNGQPGALFFDREGGLIAVMILDVAEGQIQGVSSVVNPDKLRHLGPVADLNALVRGPRGNAGGSRTG